MWKFLKSIMQEFTALGGDCLLEKLCGFSIGVFLLCITRSVLLHFRDFFVTLQRL